MVAPAVLNKPRRVFARLTYTGEDRSAPPILCDLSRVASIVPANPLPSNLRSNAPQEAMTNTAKFQDSLLENGIQSSSEAKTEKSPICNRKRSHYESNETFASGNEKRIKLLNDEDEKLRCCKKERVSHLLAENEELKRQNELLKMKLRTFQKILLKEENYSLAKQKVNELKLQQGLSRAQ